MSYNPSINTLQGPYCIASIWQYSNFHWKQKLQWEHANHKYHQLSKWVPVGENLQITTAHSGHVVMQKAGGWTHISQEPMGLMRFVSNRKSSGLITTVWYICNNVFCKNKQLSDKGTMCSQEFITLPTGCWFRDLVFALLFRHSALLPFLIPLFHQCKRAHWVQTGKYHWHLLILITDLVLFLFLKLQLLSHTHNHMGILAKFQRKESYLLPVCSERSLFSRELHDFEDQFSVFKVLSKKHLFRASSSTHGPGTIQSSKYTTVPACKWVIHTCFMNLNLHAVLGWRWFL